MQSDSLDDSIIQNNKAIGDTDEAKLTNQLLNGSEFAIKGINLRKTIKFKKYGFFKDKETVLLNDVNINITKGKM